MTITVEVPAETIADLKAVGDPYLDLSLAQMVAVSVVFALYTCGDTEEPSAYKRCVDCAWELARMQTPSHD
ncbi:MAG: hypothetical protein ACR2JB_04030 [Bryobacteraceae bacterium]